MFTRPDGYAEMLDIAIQQLAICATFAVPLTLVLDPGAFRASLPWFRAFAMRCCP